MAGGKLWVSSQAQFGLGILNEWRKVPHMGPGLS